MPPLTDISDVIKSSVWDKPPRLAFWGHAYTQAVIPCPGSIWFSLSFVTDLILLKKIFSMINSKRSFLVSFPNGTLWPCPIFANNCLSTHYCLNWTILELHKSMPRMSKYRQCDCLPRSPSKLTDLHWVKPPLSLFTHYKRPNFLQK